MKEYCEKQFRKSTLKLELARIGYESKIKELANELYEKDASLHEPIIEAINELRTAINEMVEDADYDKARYQTACETEGAKSEEDSE
jgi:hypothetical protein